MLIYLCLPHIERDFRVQPQRILHLLGSSSQEVVEYMVGPLLGLLGADTRLLQKVVRHMATHHLELCRSIKYSA